MSERIRGDNRLSDVGLRRKRLEPGKPLRLQDGGGLRLEMSERAGRRLARAVYRFQLNGKRSDLYLGTWPDKSLSELRALRNEARQHVKRGDDPRVILRAAKEAAERASALARARPTVASTFANWDRLHLRQAFKDEGAEVRRVFGKDVLPSLGALPLEELGRSHVAGVVDAVLERGAPRAAQLLLAYLRQFCRWALARGYLEADPTAAMSKAAIHHNRPRERVLSEPELRELARRLPAARLPTWAPPAMWLILATAVRVGELLGARWADIDLDHAQWLIPAENAKNGREHHIDLSPFALAQMRRLAALRCGPWLVAGRAKDGTKPVDGRALTKLIADRQRPADAVPLMNRATGQDLVLPGGRWRAHDLRRTAATLMQELGTAPAVIERCLNHTEPRQLVRVYQRYDYRAERREALNRLGECLEQLATTHGGPGS